MPLKIVFMGTPDFSVPVLDAVAAAGHHVVAVYSQPPRPAGRGMAEVKSPVHRRAEALGIAVRTPVNFKNKEDQAAFAALGADAAVVVAYGLLLPKAVLDATRLGCFNVHASKLPRWRGAAPIQRAIIAGDTVTAVDIMRMEQGLDTGPVCLGRDVPIPPDMTAGELHDALSKLGAELMIEALAKLEAGELQCVPQANEGATYAAKIDKGETRIGFSRPAKEVVDHIRGLSPFPGGVVRDRSRRQKRADQGARCTDERRRWRAGHADRRRADDCLRDGRHPRREAAAGGQTADDGSGFPARNAARRGRPARPLMISHIEAANSCA